jgi:hypothetical protein
MVQRVPIFLSDLEAESLEGKLENALTINVGRRSPFSNKPPKDPWTIESDLEGVTPYDLWFGMSRVVGRNLSDQFKEGVELVEWICILIANEGQDPFKALPEEKLPEKFREYLAARRAYEQKTASQLDRSNVYLVNGLYFVATQISLDPGMLSAQYSILPHNRIDFSVVYNPKWGKMSIGANTLGPMPHGSAAMIISHYLTQARELYQKTGEIYLPVVLNLDILTAVMLVQGRDLPLVWIKYAEALKLGNFTARLNKRLPDLMQVGEKLSLLDKTKGKWGSSPTFQGSARGERTAITNPEQVLMTMAEVFPKAFEDEQPFILKRSGKK